MLRDVREFMKQRKSATLEELSIHFDIPRGAVSGILWMLEQKGLVRQSGGACSSGCKSTCSGCSEVPVIYTWTGDRAAVAAVGGPAR